MSRRRGIFPIASRRHQSPTPSQRYEKDYSHDNAIAVIGVWVLVPIIALIGGSMRPDFGFLGVFIVMIGLALYVSYLIVSS